MKRLLPFIGVIYVLLASPVNAQSGHVWTCRITGVATWQMLQPIEHYDYGLRPTWEDCEAWRDGDPGDSYVWSYGPVEITTTTTEPEPEPTTTTTEPEPEPTTTTTEPEPTTTSTTVQQTTTTTTTTTTPPPPTTTSSTTTTSEPQATTTTTTSKPEPEPEPTTTTSTTITTTPPASKNLAAGSSNALAPGVTPEAQRAIVAASLGIIINRRNR